MWCDIHSEMRNLKPWVDEWTFVANHSAAALRDLAASDWASAEDHATKLDALADKLDEVVGFRHVLGGGRSFDSICADVRQDAATLIQEVVWPVPLGDESQQSIRAAVIANSRKLTGLWTRAAKDIFDGRVEKAQETSCAIGKGMAPWCYYKLGIVCDEARAELLRISLRLFELAAERTYYDGGESQRRIVSHGSGLSNELAEFVRRFLSPE